MKRPLFLLFTGLVFGETVAVWAGWRGIFILALFSVILGGFLLKMRKKQSQFFYGFLFLVFSMFLGLFLFLGDSHKNTIDFLLEKQSLSGILSGEIVRVRVKEEGGCEVVLKTPTFVTEKTAHSLKGKCKVFLTLSGAISLYPGDAVLCQGTLKELEEPGNPGQFSSKIYHQADGIFYQYFARQWRLERRPAFSFFRMAYCFKERVSGVYERILPKEKAALLKAMALGDKSGLSQDQKKLYEENGVAHLLAVSGLHVSVIGGSFFRILRKKGRSYFFSCLGGALLLFFYGCMTGFGSSVLRAVLMFAFFLGAAFLGMEYDMISAMSLAGIFMLVEHPCRMLEGGFLISFLSILAIGLVLPVVRKRVEEREKNALGEGEIGTRRKCIKKLGNALLASGVISAVTVPFLLRFFYEWSPYSVFLNLLVLPLMTPLLLSAAAGGLLGIFGLPLGKIFCFLAWLLLSFYEVLFWAVGKLPGALVITGCPTILEMVGLYGLMVLVFFLWDRRRHKTFVALVLVGMAIACFHRDTELYITMLDIGQGECLLMRLPGGETMLIDGGSTSKKKTAEYVIEPALKYYGIAHLDYVAVTHVDEDHISGIEELLASGYPVSQFLLPKTKLSDAVYEKIKKQAVEDGAKVTCLQRGDQISFGALSMNCLHPFEEFQTEDRNASSVVLYLRYRAFDALFTGDLEESGEGSLCAYLREEKKNYPELEDGVSLLKVAHHGSRNSTSVPFLTLVNPQVCVISSGVNNRYGHPHRELLERLKKTRTKIYQTRVGGAIVIKTNGKTHEENYFRERQR